MTDVSAGAEIELFDETELRRLGGIKWSRHGPEVLAAWVADMDIRPPRVVTDAVAELAATADFGYNRRALRRLPEAFATWQHESHDWVIDPDDVRIFCDVLQAIDVVLWLETEPGDGIVLLTPIYPPFLSAVGRGGRRMVDVPLQPQDWRLDPERLLAAIDDSTRAILLCNPHNPTGRVFDLEELRAIVEVAEERDLLIISDEVWADLLHPDATHLPTATVDERAPARTVTISSASKSFNLAGLRCAAAHIGPPALAAELAAMPSHLLGAVATPGAEATLAAWTGGRRWLDALRAHLTARRDQLAAILAEEAPMIGFQVPEATYLAWLDMRRLELGPDPAGHLLDTARVALSSGLDFGPGGGGFVRLNFATSSEMIRAVTRRILGSVVDEGRATMRSPRAG